MLAGVWRKPCFLPFPGTYIHMCVFFMPKCHRGGCIPWSAIVPGRSTLRRHQASFQCLPRMVVTTEARFLAIAPDAGTDCSKTGGFRSGSVASARYYIHPRLYKVECFRFTEHAQNKAYRRKAKKQFPQPPGIYSSSSSKQHLTPPERARSGLNKREKINCPRVVHVPTTNT